MVMRVYLKNIAIVLLLARAVVGAASADVIQLKSGGHVDGTITAEDEKRIILNIGTGTLTIQKNNIASIIHSSGSTTAAVVPAEKRSFVFTDENTPKELLDILHSLHKLEEQRFNAGQTYQRLLALQKTSEQDDKRFVQLQDQQLALTKELSQPPSRNNNAIKNYNNRVAQLNGMGADILELSKKNEKTHAAIDQCRRDLSDYTATLFMFADQVKQRKQQRSMADAATASSFFAAMNRSLHGYLGETRQVQIPYQQNKHSAQVIAKLNGTISASFVVDTGCTGMTISEKLANKLNLTPMKQQATATLANGSTVKCQVARLDSVEVEGMRVNNILVMIMPNSPNNEVDGLLGMSFLMAFNIRLDPTANTVTLTQFAPR